MFIYWFKSILYGLSVLMKIWIGKRKEELKHIFDMDLISEEEYNKKRKDAVDNI